MKKSIILNLCGIFYAGLCIFSIVVGIIYIIGLKEINPVELPDSFVSMLDSNGLTKSFAQIMGVVTFIVGIIQGLSSYCIIFGKKRFQYGIAIGFTAFSILSAGLKLISKFSLFPLIKIICYIAILIILLLKTTRAFYINNSKKTNAN